jgi:hypothetical protein
LAGKIVCRKKVPAAILGPKREDVTKDGENSKKQELLKLYYSLKIIKIIKSTWRKCKCLAGVGCYKYKI